MGVLRIVAVAAAYAAAARLGLLLAFEKTNASPVWPPSGIALAALCLWGTRVWPGVWLGAFVANLIVFMQNLAAAPLLIAGVSAFVGAGNSLEALAGRFLIDRYVPGGRPFDRAGDVVRFSAIAPAMCAVSALIGPTAICGAGLAEWRVYGTMWLTWWLGDAAGVLVVGSLILCWAHERRRIEAVEPAVALAAAATCAWFGFEHGLTFLLLPPLVWVALRFGPREAATAMAAASILAVVQTIRGRGFYAGSVNESLLVVQAFIGVVTVTVLSMTAVVSERRAAQAALQEAHDLLESRVRERTAELEAFTYSVSHDLRAPLRAIEGFSRILLGEHASKLDAPARECLDRVNRSARQMSDLIDALLQFSRLGRAPVRKRRVAPAAIVRAVLDGMATERDGRAVDVKVGDLPECEADPTLLAQVWANLLSNARKFTRGRSPAVIEVGHRDGSYFVADNGVGFDMEHATRLFGVFQRLHTQEQFEGTGIGLALVRRIVERHGGRIWAEAKPGEGATFRFTLGG